jgi:hypothetical protein
MVSAATLSNPCNKVSNRLDSLRRNVHPNPPKYGEKPRFFNEYHAEKSDNSSTEPLSDNESGDEVEKEEQSAVVIEKKLKFDQANTIEKTGNQQGRREIENQRKSGAESAELDQDMGTGINSISLIPNEEKLELDQEVTKPVKSVQKKADDKSKLIPVPGISGSPEQNLLETLPDDLSLVKIYNYLDIDSAYNLTSATRLFLTHRDEALDKYRKKEIGNKIGNWLNYYSENINLLDKKAERDKLIGYLKALERTYLAPKSKRKIAEVHFNEKTIAVAIKLVMHNNESRFLDKVILEKITRIPGDPINVNIQYDYRRIVYGMLAFDVCINYNNQGLAFDRNKVNTYSKFAQVPRSLFNGFVNESLASSVNEKLRILDEQARRERQESSSWRNGSKCILS